MNILIVEAIKNLNEKYFNDIDYKSENYSLFTFDYHTDGNNEKVRYMGVDIYDSNNDYQNFIDNEEVEKYLVTEVRKVNKDFNVGRKMFKKMLKENGYSIKSD